MATEAPRTRFDLYLEDILAAPDELAAVLDLHATGIAGLPEEAFERPRWVFTGMGSSRFAAMDAAAALRAFGHEAVAELASASGGVPPSDDTLLVAISSSGRTPEVVAAAERHRGRSIVLALTGETDSPLARASSVTLPLVAAREEAGGVSVLSYRSTVAALQLLCAQVEPGLAAAGIAASVPALEALMADRASWLVRAADLVNPARPVVVLGDGSRAGAVEQAALMLREGPRLDAAAFDTGDWLHVGLYTLFPGDTVVLFRGSAADDEAIATIHARGATIIAVGDPHADADLGVPLPSAALEDPGLRALVEPAVADLLAAELWGRADARVLREGEATV